jgi:hypothetical protein
MAEAQIFSPPKAPGIILHGFLILLLLGGSGVLIFLAFSRSASWSLILYLLGALFLLALTMIAGYRAYALLHGKYTVERDGLRVRWGLRSEDVPLPEVFWVRPATDLVKPLRLPPFSLPGAILGSTNHEELGQVEFIASSLENLVIVATANKTLVLSPEDPQDFVNKFQRVIEMGSLYPIAPHSAVPVAFVQQIFGDRYARILILSMAGFTLVMLLITSLLIPVNNSVSLGYDVNGVPLPPVNSNRLLLLPIISILFTILNLVIGMFFFRHLETRKISYFIWATGVLSSFLFLLGVIILVVNSA